MNTAETIVTLWGGNTVLGKVILSENELIPVLRQGLPFSALERLMETFGLSREEIAVIIGLPLRTMVRRKRENHLASDESDRLYRLSRVLAHCAAVFNDTGKVKQWLRRPNRALNGEIPLLLLDTDIGASQVDDVLGRLEHGIFS